MNPWVPVIREWIKGLELAHDRMRANLFIMEDLIALAQKAEQQGYERAKAELQKATGHEEADQA